MGLLPPFAPPAGTSVGYLGGPEAVRAERHTEGKKEGKHGGEACGLGPQHRQVEQRLDRPLTETEGAEFVQRLGSLGPDRLGNVVLDFATVELAAWLADPNAR